jgi:hypothetical protein
LAALADLGLDPLRLADVGLGDEFRQPRPSILAVLLLGPVASGSDDDLARRGHACAGKLLQAGVDVRGEAELEHVAAQLDCSRDLVDVLAAGPLDAMKLSLERLFRDW